MYCNGWWFFFLFLIYLSPRGRILREMMEQMLCKNSSSVLKDISTEPRGLCWCHLEIICTLHFSELLLQLVSYGVFIRFCLVFYTLVCVLISLQACDLHTGMDYALLDFASSTNLCLYEYRYTYCVCVWMYQWIPITTYFIQILTE